MGSHDQKFSSTALINEERGVSYGIERVFECFLEGQSEESCPAYCVYQPHLF